MDNLKISVVVMFVISSMVLSVTYLAKNHTSVKQGIVKLVQ